MGDKGEEAGRDVDNLQLPGRQGSWNRSQTYFKTCEKGSSKGACLRDRIPYGNALPTPDPGMKKKRRKLSDPENLREKAPGPFHFPHPRGLVRWGAGPYFLKTRKPKHGQPDNKKKHDEFKFVLGSVLG